MSEITREIQSESSVPYTQKCTDSCASNLTPTTKSYKNEFFLSSYDGRLIRMICEFEEPKQRLRKNYIRSTVLFFGSARSMNRSQFNETHSKLQESLEKASNLTDRAQLEKDISQLKKCEWMCKWVDVVEELAKLVAEFAQNEHELIRRSFNVMPDYFRMNAHDGTISVDEFKKNCSDLVVTTGGGPGFMEAANKGAASVPNTKTMGMGISLPYEKGLNAYVTDGLAFEFHYFFTRKFWMMYSCRAIVVAPGGFGTLDETFELLTLRQTRKIPNLPIVLIGRDFWTTVINWQSLSDYGVIAQSEIDSLYITDSAAEAMAYIHEFYETLTSKKN